MYLYQLISRIVHNSDEMYRYDDPPNFRSFAEALKAGNPDAIVAFNPGVQAPVICHTEYEDFTAGELTDLLAVGGWGLGGNPKYCNYGPIRRFVDGAQFHVLNFLGPWWAAGPPRFPAELVAGYTPPALPADVEPGDFYELVVRLDEEDAIAEGPDGAANDEAAAAFSVLP